MRRGAAGGDSLLKEDAKMEVDLIFQVAAVGILVAVLNILLTLSLIHI